MTKFFTRTDGTTHSCESETTTCAVRDTVDGKPTMKLIHGNGDPHALVFGTPAQMCDEVEDHTI